jgi:hypothetical protein
MKEIIGFIRVYYRQVNKPVLLFCTLFLAVLIWFNYQYRLEYRFVNRSNIPFPSFTGHFAIYFIAFVVPHLLLLWQRKKRRLISAGFLFCLLLGPIFFAVKVSLNTYINLAANDDWNRYWNEVTYWPLRLIVLLILLSACRSLFHREGDFLGLRTKKIDFRPYGWMLLLMVPLIAAASTQPDFLSAYPKMRSIIPLPPAAEPGWFYKLLFELSYGSDFFSIEIFFRGFLVIGFLKWAGKDAILPMACFYCTIHFGKPLGECISSYLGGLLLGIVAYNTRSIYGGLMVHLGIAWLMELGGHLGNILAK